MLRQNGMSLSSTKGLIGSVNICMTVKIKNLTETPLKIKTIVWIFEIGLILANELLNSGIPVETNIWFYVFNFFNRICLLNTSIFSPLPFLHILFYFFL